MKITPLGGSSLGAVATQSGALDPQATRVQDSIRRLKMTTQVSPDRESPPPAATPPAPEGGESAISDTDEANGTEVTKPISPQLAFIAKQRRALQVKERELNDLKKELESRSQVGTIELSRLKSEPLRVLQESGVTYDQLTEAILADQNSPEFQALKAEVESLKEGIDKNFTDRDQKQKQQALSEMRRETLQLSADGDEFEMIRTERKADEVVRFIETHYDETGEVLDVRDAMTTIEEILVEDAVKKAQAKKIQSRLTPPPIAPQVPEPQSRQMRTLTNKDTASPVISKRARAMAAFYGTLAK